MAGARNSGATITRRVALGFVVVLVLTVILVGGGTMSCGEASCAVPEPASASLLLLGDVALLRRRKK